MENNYILYLLSIIEKELFIYASNSKFNDLLKFINVLKGISERKTKNDLIKYSYILLKVKQFERLGAYLLFVIKKSEQDIINFDNLNDNINFDKEFIKNELLSCFKIKLKESAEEKTAEIIDENKTIIENIKDSKKFYETIENEFLYSGIADMLENIQDENKKNEEIKEKEEDIKQEDKKREINLTLVTKIEQEESDEKIFDLPEERKTIIKKEETKQDKIREEELLPEESGVVIKRKIKVTDKKEPQNNLEHDKMNKEEKKVKKIHIDHFDEDFYEIDKYTGKKEVTETFNVKNPDKNKQQETTELKEKEQKENLIFKQYETDLYSRNLVISESLNKIKEIINKYEESLKILGQSEMVIKGKKQVKKENKKHTEPVPTIYSEEKEKLLNETFCKIEKIANSIILECNYMEERSKEISFEIISNIYSTISEVMQKALAETKEKNKISELLAEEKTNLFINGIILIRKLVAGEDYTGYEKIVEDIEEIKNKIIEEKKEEAKKQELEKKKEELERKLTEKYSNISQRRKLLLLKEKILNIENIFKSLESIDEEYQIYNALTNLSKTFNNFKDIVILSKELKIDKMAKLSEAGYIFIKYIQNYRMNPLNKEVKEVLNYIVVNLKLLFLDKRGKDLDLFISYLNNPEKIFS